MLVLSPSTCLSVQAGAGDETMNLSYTGELLTLVTKNEVNLLNPLLSQGRRVLERDGMILIRWI